MCVCDYCFIDDGKREREEEEEEWLLLLPLILFRRGDYGIMMTTSAGVRGRCFVSIFFFVLVCLFSPPASRRFPYHF